jgi:hypothetical protein
VVHHRIRPVQVLEIPVLRAVPQEPDISPVFCNFRIDSGIAGRAKAAGLFYQHRYTPTIEYFLAVLVTLMFTPALYYRYWGATVLALSSS